MGRMGKYPCNRCGCFCWLGHRRGELFWWQKLLQCNAARLGCGGRDCVGVEAGGGCSPAAHVLPSGAPAARAVAAVPR